MRKATNRSGRDNREGGRGDSGDGAAAAAAPGLLAEQSQLEAFDGAMRAFHAGDFTAALEAFERAERGPAREMAHSARVHARMCARRMGQPELALNTPEDHYNYAVALINERRLEQAEKHLLLAMAQNPKGDHLFYALALCRGLGGDADGAYANLKRAIDLQPRNKVAARNDPDFAEIGQQQPLAHLLYPERM